MLQEALQDLAARRQLVVVQPDFHALLLAVRADPKAHGFLKLERPVLVTEPPSPGQGHPQAVSVSHLGAVHLCWDDWAHLTTAFHRLLAAQALRSLQAEGLAAA